MQDLSDHGRALRDDLSARYGLSPDAVQAMMEAVARGGGAQAQFDIPELGGMGQWQQGGMIMVGDMFNSGLQARVANLCSEIAQAWLAGSFHASRTGSAAAGRWWPEELGVPSSTGMQNDQGYAIFPQARRLALLQGGRVRVFDTGPHQIGGVGQQQSGSGSVSFTSQLGSVRVEDLTPVPHPGDPAAHAPQSGRPAPASRGDAAAPADQGVPEAGAEGGSVPAAGESAGAPGAAKGPWATPGRDAARDARADAGHDPGARAARPPAEPERPAPAPAPAAAPSDTRPRDASPRDAATPRPAPPSSVRPEGGGADAAAPTPAPMTADAIYDMLSRLAALRDAGVLTEEEFSAKKTELLARI